MKPKGLRPECKNTQVHLPSGLVSEGTEIMVVVPLPTEPRSEFGGQTTAGRLARYSPGISAFAVPYRRDIVDQLHYEDARTVGALSANDQPDQTVGLIA